MFEFLEFFCIIFIMSIYKDIYHIRNKTLSDIIDGIPILYLVADNFCSSVNTE